MPSLAQEAPRSIVIATEGAYEPWNYTAPDGTLHGFEVDLANDLCARMQIECSIVAQNWDGLIPALNGGRFDAIMASLIVTEQRLDAIAFSEPYAPTSAALMVESQGPLADLPSTGDTVDLDDGEAASAAIEVLKGDLEGTIIGAQVATANVAFLEKYLKDTVEIREYRTVEQHDLDLSAGRIDGAVAQVTSLQATLARPEFSGFAISGPVFTGDVFGRGIAVGLRKDDAQLKALFDEAIAAAREDGTIERLTAQWFEPQAR